VSAPAPLPVARIAELRPPQRGRRGLVDGLWSRAAVGIIGGAPKWHKSWLALDLAVSVASGTPCLGAFDVLETGPALLYMAEDEAATVRARVAGLCRHRGPGEASSSESANPRIVMVEIMLLTSTKSLSWAAPSGKYSGPGCGRGWAQRLAPAFMPTAVRAIVADEDTTVPMGAQFALQPDRTAADADGRAVVARALPRELTKKLKGGSGLSSAGGRPRRRESWQFSVYSCEPS